MRFKIGIPVLAIGLSMLMAAPAFAQVSVEFDAPGIAFEDEPGLVEIEPGISVVPDYGEEVFFMDGWYWYRWQENWYRASDWRGGWVVAPPPPRLLHLHFGHYRNWHGGRVIRPGRPVVVRPPGPSRVVAPPRGPSRVVAPSPVPSGGVAPPPYRGHGAAQRVVAPPPRRAPAPAPVAAPPPARRGPPPGPVGAPPPHHHG